MKAGSEGGVKLDAERVAAAIAMLTEGLKRHERQEWSWQFGRLEECAKQALEMLRAAAEPEVSDAP